MSETKAAGGGDQKDPVVRIIARTLFEREFKAATPGATAEQARAAWGAQRKDYVKAAKQFQARLAKRGLSMQANADAKDED
jgi:hypothetical protein